MFVVVDDSGDPGFKINKGSSPCLVIALVIFDDHHEAETCAVEREKLRRELYLSDQFEFNFNQCSAVFRKAFLTRLVSCQFRVRAIVMRTDAIESAERRESNESCYRYAIRLVLQHSVGTIKKARLKMDGHEDRAFRRELHASLRRQRHVSREGAPILEDVRIVDSNNHVLIQLADMGAGTLRRHAEQEKKEAMAS
jgi:hypothetical protein